MTDKVAIIGKGMIGISLAALFNGNQIPVAVLAKEEDVGRQRYRACYDYLVQQGLMTQSQAEKCETLLCFTQEYADIADVDIVFECVAEELTVKHEVYAKLEMHCKNLKAIASASSAYSPEDLAKHMHRKEILLVAHPWNPPHLVPCVEIVPNRQTSQQAVQAVVALLKAAKRKPVCMEKPAPGFIANRIQHAMTREALHMVAEGIAKPEDIDTAIKTSFAPRYTSIGLFEHMDNAGLDLAKNVQDYLFGQLGNENCANDFINEKVACGRLGVKTGAGVYEWTPERIADMRARAAKPYLAFFDWNLPKV